MCATAPVLICQPTPHSLVNTVITPIGISLSYNEENVSCRPIVPSLLSCLSQFQQLNNAVQDSLKQIKPLLGREFDRVNTQIPMVAKINISKNLYRCNIIIFYAKYFSSISYIDVGSSLRISPQIMVRQKNQQIFGEKYTSIFSYNSKDSCSQCTW